MSQIKFEETHRIYNAIKKKMDLNDEALQLLGISKEAIDKGIKQCRDAGLSKKQAMKTIMNMWNEAEVK